MSWAAVLFLFMQIAMIALLIVLVRTLRGILDELRTSRVVMKGATTVNESIAQDTQRAAGRIETAASKIEKSTGYPGTPGMP